MIIDTLKKKLVSYCVPSRSLGARFDPIRRMFLFTVRDDYCYISTIMCYIVQDDYLLQIFNLILIPTREKKFDQI